MSYLYFFWLKIMKHFQDGNTEIPYENKHFEDWEYENRKNLERPIFFNDEWNEYYDNLCSEGGIKHFQE